VFGTALLVGIVGGRGEEGRPLIHKEVAKSSVLRGLLHRLFHRIVRRADEETDDSNRLSWMLGGNDGSSEARSRSVNCLDGTGRSGRRVGAEAQIRTGDTRLFRAVLYQLSYLGTMAGTTGFEPAISGVTIQRPRPD
jgi:hypothetical protein